MKLLIKKSNTKPIKYLEKKKSKIVGASLLSCVSESRLTAKHASC